MELDRQFRDEPTQIRVTMGKEPRHFMAMFGGKMLVYEGGTGRSSVQTYQGPSQLFQVRGVDEVSTKAFEVMPVSGTEQIKHLLRPLYPYLKQNSFQRLKIFKDFC